MAPQENFVGLDGLVKAVKAFRELRDIELNEKDKSSFLDHYDRSERCVHLQLTMKKMSAAQTFVIKSFIFPHCLLQEDDEVCFIVGCKEGDKGNKRADHERYANEYKQKLRSLGIEREIHILPIMQLETEFKSYEAKRKLCQAFDHFICDHRIIYRMPQLLGYSFFRRRKMPIRVYMKKESELKEKICLALQKVLFCITAEGPNVSMKVGNLYDHSDEQIAENIRSVLDTFIPENFPGGVDNVNSIHLASFAGRSVPVYVSLLSANAVDMSETDKKFVEKQTPKELEDTIDTMPGVRVKVRSDGKVIAVKDESQQVVADELLDQDYLDVFRDQEFEERDEAKKRHVKHLARKATLRKVGKRFGSNMLKLPSHVRISKPAGASAAKQEKLPEQKSKNGANLTVLDALQGFDEKKVALNDDEIPQLVPIANKAITRRKAKSLGNEMLGAVVDSGIAESKAKKNKLKRKSTTVFVEETIAETPAKKKLRKSRISEVAIEEPKQKTPSSKRGMTVTRIDTRAVEKNGKPTTVDSPRPILKTPRKTPGKEKRKSVTFDFTPDSDVNPKKSASKTVLPNTRRKSAPGTN